MAWVVIRALGLEVNRVAESAALGEALLKPGGQRLARLVVHRHGPASGCAVPVHQRAGQGSPGDRTGSATSPRIAGWVNAGVDHDTSVFAVESIRRWWKVRGGRDYPQASRLLITADAGGSNSYRYRVWKSELAALAAETGLAITVCHFPPGTQCRCLTN